MKKHKKYILVFIITLGIFIVVFGLVDFLNNKKLAHVDGLQRNITADLLARETQFELLKTAPCDLLGDSVLSQELGEFGRKLDLAETNQGSDNDNVVQLKKYYSLLQVKDYLLMQELAQKCNTQIDSILYFYQDDCPKCTKQGYVLTEIKKRYPQIRIYSFDTDLDFSVIETFSSLYDFGEVYPAIIVGDTSYQGLQKINDIELLFPEIVKQKKDQEQLEQVREFVADETQTKPGDVVLEQDDTLSYSFILPNDQKGIVTIDPEGNLVLQDIKEKTSL